MSCAPIGQRLLAAGLISRADLDAALDEQRRLRRRKLGQVLVEGGLLSRETVELAVRIKGAASLGQFLLEQELIRAGDLERALDRQRRQRAQRLGDLLVAMGAVSRARLEAFLAQAGEGRAAQA